MNEGNNQTKVNDGRIRSFAKGLTGKTAEVLLDTLVFSQFLAAPASAGLAIAVELVCFLVNFENERLWNLTDWNREVTGNKVNEKCSRSIARALTGRTLEVAVDTALLSIFAETPLALGLAVVVEAVCFVTGLINDRLWNHTDWKREIVDPIKREKKKRDETPLPQTRTTHEELYLLWVYNRFHPL